MIRTQHRPGQRAAILTYHRGQSPLSQNDRGPHSPTRAGLGAPHYPLVTTD